MQVHPKPGLNIIRPDTLKALPPQGADVPDTNWCLRGIRSGDLLPGLLSVTPTPTPVPTPTPTPASGFTAAQFAAGEAAYLASLPTADPHILGAEWNNGGTRCISQG